MPGIYKPDAQGFAELAKSSMVQGLTLDAAEAGAEYLRGIAPVRSGAYRDSISVESATGWDGRAAAAIVVDVDYAWAVETVNGDHPLARTADWIENGR